RGQLQFGGDVRRKRRVPPRDALREVAKFREEIPQRVVLPLPLRIMLVRRRQLLRFPRIGPPMMDHVRDDGGATPFGPQDNDPGRAVWQCLGFHRISHAYSFRPERANAPGERRPTGYRARPDTEPALWAVCSTGRLCENSLIEPTYHYKIHS